MPPEGASEPFPPQPIVIRQSPGAGWKPVVGGLLLAGLGWLLWRQTVGWYPLGGHIVGLLTAVCSGLLVCLGIRSMVRPRVALVVDRDGIVADPRAPSERVLWSDLKGAHLAVIESRSGHWLVPRIRTRIVALELVDAAGVYARLDAGKPRWLGYDSGVRPDHFAIPYDDLEIDGSRLMYVIGEGISRHGRPNPDPKPRTVYPAFFARSPGRREVMLAAAIFVVIAAMIVLASPPRWVDAGGDCEVRNRYGGKQWRRARTVATWTGPCADGRAQGQGVLEWFRDGALTVRYEGEMSGGRIDGRGALQEPYGIRYDGLWKDGDLQQGTAIYPDGRRYEGQWYKGRWTRGVLTAPGGRRLEGRWSGSGLIGKGVAEGPEGRYEGNWTSGKPEGMGVIVTRGGRRYEGKWHDGRPADGSTQGLEDLECLWSAAIGGIQTVGGRRCRGQ
jgi:hypothetical protein